MSIDNTLPNLADVPISADGETEAQPLTTLSSSNKTAPLPSSTEGKGAEESGKDTEGGTPEPAEKKKAAPKKRKKKPSKAKRDSAPQRQYTRVLGTGALLSVEFRNHALGRMFRQLAAKVDNQAALIHGHRGGPEALEPISALLDEQVSELKKAIDQLEVYLAEERVKVGYAGTPFSEEFTVTTPITGKFVKTLSLADDAMSRLHALWAAGAVHEQDFREQTRKIRARSHNFSRAVDSVFRRVVKGEEANEAGVSANKKDTSSTNEVTDSDASGNPMDVDSTEVASAA